MIRCRLTDPPGIGGAAIKLWSVVLSGPRSYAGPEAAAGGGIREAISTAALGRCVCRSTPISDSNFAIAGPVSSASWEASDCVTDTA